MIVGAGGALRLASLAPFNVQARGFALLYTRAILVKHVPEER
jgi:hypothetical protein